MNVDGSGVTTLISHRFRKDTYALWDMGVSKPAWSPDGKRIAFEHLGDGDMQPAQVFIMDADGTNPHLATGAATVHYAESDPAWSPDGARLAFWSFGYRVATVPAAGGTPTSFYGGAVWYGSRPAWSPDGTRIAFTVGQGSAAGPSIMVATSGGAASLLVSGGFDADWSRTNGLIAYVVAVPQ
jgi:Tol biopolymer transport system component